MNTTVENNVRIERPSEIPLGNMLHHIQSRTPVYDVLDCLAEESAELTHAALKLSRIMHKALPSPVTLSAAQSAIREELADVLVCAAACGLIDFDANGSVSIEAPIRDKVTFKTRRWYERAKELASL